MEEIAPNVGPRIRTLRGFSRGNAGHNSKWGRKRISD
jgi:hypothetical protein